MLDTITAHKYAAAWAKKVRAETDFQNLRQAPEGDFFGKLGSLGFDYSAKDHMLAVRSYLFAYSASFNANPDLVAWLNRSAVEEPSSVSGAIFESCVPRWEPDKQPSLFLRINITDGNLSDSAVVAKLILFRDNGVLWSRSKLTKAIDSLVRNQREKRERVR